MTERRAGQQGWSLVCVAACLGSFLAPARSLDAWLWIAIAVLALVAYDVAGWETP